MAHVPIGPQDPTRSGRLDSVWLSVVIPVRDEAECLDALWRRLEGALRGLRSPWEVIFIDDGSTDGSLGQLIDLQSRCSAIRILRMERNRGQSAALAAGFASARGDWVVTLDADLQNPPEEIPRLIAASRGVDLVFGRRRVRHDRWIKRASSRVANLVRNAVTGHRVNDAGCALRLMRRTALLRLPQFQGMHRFLPTLFDFHGFAVREIDVAHERRLTGHSKYGIRDRLWHGLADCLAVRWIGSRALVYRVEEIGARAARPVGQVTARLEPARGRLRRQGTGSISPRSSR